MGKQQVARKEIVGTDEARTGRDVARLAPGEGSKSLWVLGELMTYKVLSDQTGGAYSLFEVTTPPGSGPPPHVQHREDEAFYVLEGDYEFLVEDRTLRVPAGSLLYVPRGNLHTHKNVGEGTSRMLVSQTPGGLHERFFEELGEPAAHTSAAVPGEPPNVQRIVRIAAEYGIEISPLPAGWSGDGKETQG